MADQFTDHATSLIAPARDGAEITPSNSTDLDQSTRGLYVGTSGSLRVRLVSGATVTFAEVLAGTIYPIRVNKVFSSGTSAGGLVGLL